MDKSPYRAEINDEAIRLGEILIEAGINMDSVYSIDITLNNIYKYLSNKSLGI